MKKGLPKCVCAPNCKATAAANKSQRVNAKKIAVIQMPETRNLRRNEKRLTPSEMQSDEPTLIVANFNRRQANKKTNQRADNKKNSKDNPKEALIYLPLMNANPFDQSAILQKTSRNMSNNATDVDAKVVEMKLRSGFFNENTARVTSYMDGFHVGNFVSLFVSCTCLFNLVSIFSSKIFSLLFEAEIFPLQSHLWFR